MPLLINKLFPEEEFQENFNNSTWPQKTLVLFNVKKNSHRGVLGSEYNNPGEEHAEEIALKEIEDYFPEKSKVKYKITLYSSYTPCNKCCNTIQLFLGQRIDIRMEIQASRLYFPANDDRIGLCRLKDSGVSIKIMDRHDYQKCFNMFVHPSKKFNPWPKLDDNSKKNANDLDELWKENCTFAQEERKGVEEKGKRKAPSYDEMIDSPSTSGMERTLHSGSEIPAKLSSSDKTIKVQRGAKKKKI